MPQIAAGTIEPPADDALHAMTTYVGHELAECWPAILRAADAGVHVLDAGPSARLDVAAHLQQLHRCYPTPDHRTRETPVETQSNGRRRPWPQAVLEVGLGVLVGVAALLTVVFVVAGAAEILSKGFSWVDALFVIVPVPVFAWCVETSWRLITGRSRKDGGLLSPGVLAFAGAAIARGWPVRHQRRWLRAVPRAALFVTSGITTVTLAWTRHRHLQQRRTQHEAALSRE